MKRISGYLVAAALLAPGLALASDLELDCPAGARQVGGQNSRLEATLCMKGELAHGPYVRQAPSGQILVQGQHENNLRTGTWSFYDERGVKTEEIEFQRSDFHGKKVTFHPNGRKKLEETYVQGRKEGLVRKFDTAGDVREVLEFRGNLLVRR